MESNLKGLEEIYTDNNPRVQTTKSSIAELRTQLEKLGGGEPGKKVQNGEFYPSIRKLPVLGVTYYDLYRNVKIQEAVYETLTAQYEMEKLEEVKDTPSVKVLESSRNSGTKIVPSTLHRGHWRGCACHGWRDLWVFLRRRWESAAPDDPRKLLALEVYESVNARMPWSPPNGSASACHDPPRLGSFCQPSAN